jgi:hypothetical protein
LLVAAHITPRGASKLLDSKEKAMRIFESATASLVALGAQILVVSTVFI